MINQLPSQFIASLCIIFTEVQHVEVKIVQQRRKNTVPTPFFPLLKPSTPLSLKSNIYAPSTLLPPPLAHRRCSLSLNQLSGQQKARTGQPRTQHRGRTPGCSGLRARGPASRTTARARVHPGTSEAPGAGAAVGTAG